MNIIKFVLSVLFSTCFTTATLAVVSYLVKGNGSISFIENFDSKFNMMVGGIYGAVTGAVAGIIISGLILVLSLNLNIFTGAICGLVFNLLLPVILIVSGNAGGGFSDEIKTAYYASLIIGTINGALISLISSPQTSLR